MGLLSMAVGDLRGLPADALADLRRRVVAAVEAGASQVQVARLFGVSRQTVGAWVRAYRNRGDSAFRPHRRGRRPGEQLALTAAQQLWIAQTIVRRTPDEVGLLYLVWTRQAVAELINREFRVMLGISTVGTYLVRWGLPYPQDLLRNLRGRNAVAVTDPLRHDEAATNAPAWIPGAEVVWVGHGSPAWPIRAHGEATGSADSTWPQVHDQPGWPDISVLQAVSNRGAMFFLSCSDPFDGRELCAFLERLIGQLRRRVNLIVSWQPIRNCDDIREWLAANVPNAAIRFLSPLGDQHAHRGGGRPSPPPASG
jgi:transposase